MSENKRACFLITEVREGVFSIRSVSPDEKPGRVDSSSFVTEITGIPEGITARSITDIISRFENLKEPPDSLSWKDLTDII